MAKPERARVIRRHIAMMASGIGACGSIGTHDDSPQAALSPYVDTLPADASADPSAAHPHDNNDQDVAWGDHLKPDLGLTPYKVMCGCGEYASIPGLRDHYKKQCPLTKDSEFVMTGLTKKQAELYDLAASMPIKSMLHNESKSSDGGVAPSDRFICPDCLHISPTIRNAKDHQKSKRICKGSSEPEKVKAVMLQCCTWHQYDDTSMDAPLSSAPIPKTEPGAPTKDRPGEDPYPGGETSIDVPNERMPNSSTFSIDQTARCLLRDRICPGIHQANSISGLYHPRVAADPTGYLERLGDDLTKVTAVEKHPPPELRGIIRQMEYDVTFAHTITRELPGNVLAAVQNFYDGAGNPEEVKSRGCFSPRDNYGPIVKCGQFLMSYTWVFHRRELEKVVRFMGRSGYTVQEGYSRGIIAGLVYDLVVQQDCITKARIPMFDAMALMSLTNHGKHLTARSNDSVARLISDMLHFIRLFGGCAKTLLYMSHPSPQQLRQPTDIAEAVNKTSLVHHLAPILHSTRAEYQARPKTRDVHSDKQGNITVRSFFFPAPRLSQLYPSTIRMLRSLLDRSLG